MNHKPHGAVSERFMRKHYGPSGLVMKTDQTELMKFDPATGDERPYPSHAEQWRKWHGYTTAWLFNPWTGVRRDARDVGSDVLGHLCFNDAPTQCARIDAALAGKGAT